MPAQQFLDLRLEQLPLVFQRGSGFFFIRRHFGQLLDEIGDTLLVLGAQIFEGGVGRDAGINEGGGSGRVGLSRSRSRSRSRSVRIII